MKDRRKQYTDSIDKLTGKLKPTYLPLSFLLAFIVIIAALWECFSW